MNADGPCRFAPHTPVAANKLSLTNNALQQQQQTNATALSSIKLSTTTKTFHLKQSSSP
jgi:hypothetical protein